MSWNGETLGWEKYEELVAAFRNARYHVLEGQKLEARPRDMEKYMVCGCDCQQQPETMMDQCEHCDGSCGCKQQLRIAAVSRMYGTPKLIIEEYLLLDDRTRDGGKSWVSVSVYEEGRRPNLETKIVGP